MAKAWGQPAHPSYSSDLALCHSQTELPGELPRKKKKKKFGPVSLLHLRWAQLLSRVRLLVTSWTVAHQAPLSVGFPWQEYWSGLPFPPSGDLPKPGIEPTLALYHRAAKEALLHITPQTHEVSKLRRC